MPEHDRLERDILPHLPAAYTLARWITGNRSDAEDVVQEAVIRAMRSLAGFRGDHGRAWVLTIVRNTAYTWLQRQRTKESPLMGHDVPDPAERAIAPDAAMITDERRQVLRRALAQLAPPYREALVLREVEGLSYQEIATMVQAPIGTVMSRLSRAREQLARLVCCDPAADDLHREGARA